MALYDRDAECALIDRLVEDARIGRSGVLVVEGDPGLGKSSLIAYAVDRADGMQTLACRGFEAESQLAFTGLGDLLRPLADRLDALPEPQRAALAGVLAIGAPALADRLTLNVAVLGALAAAAEERPVLVTVDDAHWLDAASLESLAFAARRLDADRIAVVVTARAGEDVGFTGNGFGRLELRPIGRPAARRLLEEHLDAPAVAMERVIDLSGGNPLAVIELARHGAGADAGLDPAELPAGRVQRAFLARVLALPERSRRALVVAAAAADVDARLLGRALAELELDLSDLEPAEDARVIRLAGGGMEFSHPLARAAVYADAAPAARRAAHAAVAAAMDDPEHEDARTWHLAEAAVEPDAAVADALERSAERARSIGGYATAVAVLRRSAALSPTGRPCPADADRGRGRLLGRRRRDRAGVDRDRVHRSHRSGCPRGDRAPAGAGGGPRGIAQPRLRPVRFGGRALGANRSRGGRAVAGRSRRAVHPRGAAATGPRDGRTRARPDRGSRQRAGGVRDARPRRGVHLFGRLRDRFAVDRRGGRGR